MPPKKKSGKTKTLSEIKRKKPKDDTRRHASYVVPVAENDGKMMVLLGQETYNRKWSGFGGGLEQGETPVQGATREAWEESLGFLGERKNIQPRLVHIGQCESRTTVHNYYTLPVDYDPKLPYYYRLAYEFILHCGKSKLEKHCTEKLQIAWIPWVQLKDAVLNGEREVSHGIVLQSNFFQELDDLFHSSLSE